jgi:hypothetical protein
MSALRQARSRAKIGLGSKVIFTQSGFVGEVINEIRGMGFTRPSFDATHMDSPDLEEVRTNGQMIPGSFAQIKPATMTLHFDPSLGLPPVNDGEMIIIEFPRRKTEATPASWRAFGWVSDCDMAIPVKEKMTQTITLDFTGDTFYKKPTLL